MESDVRPTEQADSLVDVMSDSTLDPPRKASIRSADEADTCRICRGEGSEQEPLFYPCKCSGSIKFVHQDCLMEWLSHSQKKHCELCKTSFRFTKLYHPQMPQTLPTLVFIRKACMHIMNAFLTWCRGVLVASVWLFWLPWSMRFVWWGLFWIGDGGWVHEHDFAHGNFSQAVVNGTAAPAWLSNSNNSVANMTSLVVLEVAQMLLPSWVLVAPPSSALLNSLTASTNATNTTSAHSVSVRSRSLLSGIPMLQELTPSPVINRFIVDILEGQVITLGVVVVFVLVFLIREWVVQQQPMINLAAARAAVVNRPAAIERAEDEAVAPPVDPGDDEVAEDPNLALAVVQSDTSEDQSEQREVEEGTPVDAGALVQTHPSPVLTYDRPLTNPDAIESLIGDMAWTTARFRADIDVDDSDIIASLSSEFTTHAERIRITLIALQEEGSAAIHIIDAEALAELARQAQRLHAGIRHNMPDEINASLVQSAEATADWLRRAAALILECRNLGISTQQQLDSQTTGSEAVIDALNEFSDNAAGLPSVDPSALPRPAMPFRSNSSIATYIQRSLEETRPVQAVPAGTETEVHADSVNSALYGSNASRNAVRRSGSDTSTRSSEPLADGEGAAGPSEHNGDDGQLLNRDAELPAQGIVDDGQNTGNVAHTVNSDVPVQATAGSLDRLLNWLFVDIGPPEPENLPNGDDEQVVENINEEAPFIPFHEAEPVAVHEADADVDENADEEADANEEAQADALEVGINANDQDVVDDIEDLEGIMELIGMQGPLTGLFQNSVFCAVLISATVTSAVWFPYLWGKIVLVFLANPLQLAIKGPWLVFTGLTNFAIDFCLCIGGIALCWIDVIIRSILTPAGRLIPSLAGPLAWNGFNIAMETIANEALSRLVDTLLVINEATATDFYHLSLTSHTALYSIRATIASIFSYAKNGVAWTLYLINFTRSQSVTNRFVVKSVRWTCSQLIRRPKSLAGSVGTAMNLIAFVKKHAMDKKPPTSILPSEGMVNWSTSDRVVAIMAGYAFFATVGALYLKAGPPIASSPRGKKIEAIISELLQQAGGVLKVILIISIEMLLFPLYCGMLLDTATLPLFENASMQSRINLTLNSPWTSGFVHWFVGTCYMFHFALFVSMCRKIVRSGVLYFIRDPDDPTFHPVRDVLERSISSQLRKIGFSALVYGALVILCMGSVVWTIAYAFNDMFPIRWSSDTPVLEFPIDLLLYNTVAPLVVHLLKPSKVLHSIYGWWFKKCARALRLSNFLFGEENDDEEKRQTADDGSVTRDGRYVRAPASDQVRISKGRTVFVEVDDNNNRVDGQDDGELSSEDKEKFTKVFVPSWFRMRIVVFVFWVWALTAAAGLALTVAPVMLGRWTLGSLAQPGQQVNDIYTFFAGMCAFGVLSYIVASYRLVVDYLQAHVLAPGHTFSTTVASLRYTAGQAVNFAYVYGFLTLVLPMFLALLLEFYLIMPLHTYTKIRRHYDNGNTGQLPPAGDHAIHFLQDWTLGLLYLRIIIRSVMSRPTTRPARALRAIVEGGWLHPNVKLATRCFVVPCTIIALALLTLPAPLGWLWASLITRMNLAPELQPTSVHIMRFAYPAVLFVGASVWSAFMSAKALKRWRGRIKDEVYLIGERLHNFGESSPPPAPPIVKTESPSAPVAAVG